MTFSSVMAFDFGTQSIGIAIGQDITCTARPLAVLKVRHGIPDWQRVTKIFNVWQPDTLVVGLPLNMDGSEQPLTNSARQFAKRLHTCFDIKVVLHDERLSTVEARASLFEHGGYRALQKGQVDAEAAVIILESWLEQSC